MVYTVCTASERSKVNESSGNIAMMSLTPSLRKCHAIKEINVVVLHSLVSRFLSLMVLELVSL